MTGGNDAMLGRTANGLFWMFRNLERAENTARLLDAAMRMALTRDVSAAEAEWRSIIETLSLREIYERHNTSYTGIQVWNFVLRDKSNPRNVLAMMQKMRQNARLARNAISGELWEAVNESWMELSSVLKRAVNPGQLGDVIATIRRAGTQVHGAMEGSMLRDQGYHFARAGTFVERGDATARLLDVKYYLLLPSLSYVGTSLDAGQWDNILRSVGGDRSYRWLNAGRIDARGIVEFVVLDNRFPRGLAYCHSELRDSLMELARMHGEDGQSNELVRAADQRLSNLTIESIFDQGLHDFLVQFVGDNNALAGAIAEDYRFTA